MDLPSESNELKTPIGETETQASDEGRKGMTGSRIGRIIGESKPNAEQAMGPESQLTDQDSFEHYQGLRGKCDSPQNIGLDKDTYEQIAGDKDVLAMDTFEDDRKLTTPILVPTSKLYWYNQKLLSKEFPEKPIYFFTQVQPNEGVAGIVAEALQEGGVIIVNSDDSKTDHSRALQEILSKNYKLTLDRRSLMDAYLNQYIGAVKFEGKDFKKTKPFFDCYQRMVKEGLLHDRPDEGPSILDVVEGAEAQRLWEIYQNPFEDISVSSPISAGYDKKGFMDVLSDPNVIKVVNKNQEIITTVGLFVTNFDHSPWLNEDYYKYKYKHAYDTDNILIFTGIVSDENMKGSMYSLELIKLLVKVQEARDSNAIITFECNEVSANYLPRLVEFAINRSDSGTVHGLERNVAQSRFHSLSLRASQ